MLVANGFVIALTPNENCKTVKSYIQMSVAKFILNKIGFG